MEAASGWFGDGWAAWFADWAWELLDSLGIFSLGWFDALLPEGGLFGGGDDISTEILSPDAALESAAAAAAAAATAAAVEEVVAAAAEGMVGGDSDVDPDALFPDDEVPGPAAADAVDAVDAVAAAAAASAAAAAARCGPGTMWDEGTDTDPAGLPAPLASPRLLLVHLLPRC